MCRGKGDGNIHLEGKGKPDYLNMVESLRAWRVRLLEQRSGGGGLSVLDVISARSHLALPCRVV